MGVPVLILGESGSGKSASMRNFDPKEVGIFNVASKPLPFKKKLNKFDRADYQLICQKLGENKLKAYVVDDSQYLMSFELFAKAKDVGYNKFTEIAVNFKGLIDYIVNFTSPDTIVYLLHHTDKDDMGHIKPKTVGKMLDTQLDLAGLFSIVLMTDVENGTYHFITQSDGTNVCKSPMEMFDGKIDNDLKFVDTQIREYWGLSPITETVKTKEVKGENK